MAAIPHRRERRMDPRVRGQVRLDLSQAQFGSLLRVHDLSLSGVCFQTTKTVPYMTRVELALWLPDPQQSDVLTEFPCTGVVVRCDPLDGDDAPGASPYDVAVFFTDLPEITRTAIARYVHGDTEIFN